MTRQRSDAVRPEGGRATLSLDLDNEWSYLKTHGDSGWDTFPSYLDVAVPRFLSLFEELQLRVTVFVVGQDAAIDRNTKSLQAIAQAGHEIGNHSFAHEPWLHLYTDQEIEREITKAEEAIMKATGKRPVGFRGPGYALSGQVLHVLARRGYQFDASTLPSFLGPVARAYYFMTSGLDRKERQKRKILFGSWKDGLRPIDPYLWQVNGSTLLEIPVTTIPGLRVPFHVSYLIYLSRFSIALAKTYLRTTLRLCRLTGTEPSVLLHPLDLLGKDDFSNLGFFPGMDLVASKKRVLVEGFLREIKKHFTIMPLGEYAGQVRDKRRLPLKHFSA